MYVPGTKIKKPPAVIFDGNAWAIITACVKALKRADVPPAVVDEYRARAKSGDYDHLLATSSEYCELDLDSR